MSAVLRVLLVEDSDADARLILRALEKEGARIEHERVDDAESLQKALERTDFDIVLSDWRIPGFSGLGALELVKASGTDIPFILVSGTVGEERAVDAIRAGACDYVLKERLTRLLPAVQREIRRREEVRAREHTESRLRANEDRYRRILEAATEGVWTLDADAKTTFMNAAMAKMLGYEREEVVGRPVYDFVPENARALATTGMQMRVAGVGEQREIEYLRKDGSTVLCLMSASSIFSAEGVYEGALAMVSDLTERKLADSLLRATEEQLRQAQKMESIGRLAGGVAHDFNNLLSVILSYSSLMMKDLRAGDPMRDDVQEIHAAGERAVGLTRQLLAFSRQQVLQPKSLDLNEVVDMTEKMLRRLIGEDLELDVRPGADLGAVHADPGQIEQVLMNLVVNARDAMPDGGRIVVATRREVVGNSLVARLPGLKAGEYVTLSVTDNGTGMDSATLSRIFEPFFTTKSKEKGTGLGLSTVFGIVRQSGGVIDAASEPGKGSSFKVYLPRVAAVVQRERIVTRPPGSARGTETILLVEDEAAVRHVGCAILRRSGYRVLEAENGGAALLICERHPERIDLVVSDVVMPHMGGRELVERLAKIRPEMRSLLMSGYNDDEMLQRGVASSEINFLQKPVSPDLLVQKVREVLDARSAA